MNPIRQAIVGCGGPENILWEKGGGTEEAQIVSPTKFLDIKLTLNPGSVIVGPVHLRAPTSTDTVTSKSECGL